MDFYNDPLQNYLDPGEKLLWSGKPKQGLRLQARDVFMIPFSLMWGGFAFFWEAGVLGLVGFAQNGNTHHATHAPIFMAIWGIPFVLIGIYMIIGRFFYDAAMRGKTHYGITDRRTIVLKSLFDRKVTSFDYATMTNLNLVERGDRSGDIFFGSPSPYSAFSSASWPGSIRYATPGFNLLPDARAVYNLIREAQQWARK